MARQRKEPTRIEEQAPLPEEVPEAPVIVRNALPKATKTTPEDITIPEEYDDTTEAWRMAYARAFGNGCTEKAAALYADSHERDFEAGTDGVTEDKLQAQIDALQAQLSVVKGRGASR